MSCATKLEIQQSRTMATSNLMSDQKKDIHDALGKLKHEDDSFTQLPPLPKNPRELVENPAVAPEMLETAPEDLRGDLFRDYDSD